MSTALYLALPPEKPVKGQGTFCDQVGASEPGEDVVTRPVSRQLDPCHQNPMHTDGKTGITGGGWVGRGGGGGWGGRY